MNGKTLLISGALTLGLLAPAGAAVAADRDDDGPLGGVLGGILDRGDNDRKDKKKEKKKERRNGSTFRFTGDIRSVDTDDREIVVDLGKNNRTVRVADDAKIWRDGDRVALRDLERGDDVRITGEKRNGKLVAERVVADD